MTTDQLDTPTAQDDTKPGSFAPTIQGRWQSLAAAFAGIVHVVRSQPNAWIELGAAAVAVALGFWFGISGTQWIVIVTLIALMLALECVNTAIESVVDLVAPEWHPLAKVAKDSAAGALLIVATGSLVVAAIIFIPYL